jgi:LysR family transcriptional regulator, low CO2-responsive transcriptional regulator
MNYVQLRAFHLVAREGSFTRAARSLRVTQPTLSAQVKALEDGYGVRLFDRRGRRVALTELGQTLVMLTTRLFAAEEEAAALLADTRALARGQLKIGADGPYHAVPIMAAFKRRHAGIRLSLGIGNSDEVLRGLLDYRTDVAVLAKVPDDPRLFVIPFRHDRIVVFVPRTHPWAGRDNVSLADFAGCELVLREAGSVTREVFWRALAAAGVEPGPVMEIESREAVHEAVAAGLGVGAVFESELGDDPRLVALPVLDAALEVSEYVVCLRDWRRLRVVRAFLDIAQELAPAGDTTAKSAEKQRLGD